MIAVLSAPDAIVVAAIVTALAGGSWWTSRKTGKELRPNGGSTLRDAVDRIERMLEREVIPSIGLHADRISALEQSRRKPRTKEAA